MPIKVKPGDRVIIDGEELFFDSSSVEAYNVLVEAAERGAEVDDLIVSLIGPTGWPQALSFGRLRKAVEEQLGK